MGLCRIFWRERVMYMTERVIFVAENTNAIRFAATRLGDLGFTVTDEPSAAVTHILLGVPCRLTDEVLSQILRSAPNAKTVMGGFLKRKELKGYQCFDLLENEEYLAENAAITAYAALTVAAEKLPVTWDGCNVLILGWGRIGKCLAPLLKAMGAQVCVAARNPAHRAIASALGYDTVDIGILPPMLHRYRVIFNTIPAPILSQEQTERCRSDCLKIDLASTEGIAASDVITARGLPAKCHPESSGKLIAKTILQYFVHEEGTL